MARLITNEMETKLTATDSTKAALNQAQKNLKDYEKNSKSIASRMSAAWKQHWAAFAAAGYAAFRAINGAMRLMTEGAAYMEQVKAVDALGQAYGRTGEQIIKAAQEASRGLLNLKESAQVAAEGMKMGLDPEVMNRFIAVAETMTDVTGQEIPEAFKQLINAAVTGRQQTLKQMGIMLDMNVVYADYAQEIGKATQELTLQEKSQATLNAVLVQAEQKYKAVNVATDTHADKLQRARNKIEDMKLEVGVWMNLLPEMGLLAINILQTGVVQAMAWISKVKKWGMEAVASVIEGLAKVAQYIPGWGEEIEAKMNSTAFGLRREAITTGLVWEEMLKELGSEFQALWAVVGDPASWKANAMSADRAAQQNMAANNAETENFIANEQVKTEAHEQGIQTRLEREAYIAELELIKREEEIILNDEFRQSMSDAEYEYYMNEGNLIQQLTAQIMSDYDARAARITAYYQERIANANSAAEEEAAIEQYETEMHRAQAEAKAEIDRIYSETALSTFVQLFAALAGQSRSFFEMWKALAIAETIITTLKSAVDAFECFASTMNPVGYAMGIVAAALALATGYARVQQIRNTDYTGKHTGGYIGGAQEEPIYRLQRGEYVVSRTGVQTLDRLNAGEDIGMGNVSVNFNVNTNDPVTFEKYLINNKRSVSKSIWQTVRNNENRF